MNAFPPLPFALVVRGAGFSGKSNVTAPAEHDGGTAVADAAATDGATGGFVGTTTGLAVAALVGVRMRAVGSGVAISGSGVAVITLSIIHGVWVATRVGSAVGPPELHALTSTATMPKMKVLLKLEIFTLAPNFKLPSSNLKLQVQP